MPEGCWKGLGQLGTTTATKEGADTSNTHLIRYVVPIIVKGIQPAPGGQSQGCQVITGPAGIQQNHGTTHGSCLAHTGPLAQMTTEDPQGEEAPSFLYDL